MLAHISYNAFVFWQQAS
ncbi:hypothetical protein [Bacillus cereus]